MDNPEYAPRLDGDALVGGVCENCGYRVAPFIPRCPACSGRIGPARFDTSGTVWSSTVLFIPVLNNEPPTGLAYIDITKGPRILARFTGTTPLAVGTAVRITQRSDALFAEEVGT